MRSHVFTDGGLAKHAGRFVWLSIDTEKDVNAAFVEKYPIESWPTLLVIEPASEKIAFKWLGSATVAQLGRMFDDAQAAVANARAGDDPDALLTRADQLNGVGDNAGAAELYAKALQSAPSDWPKRPRCVESLLAADYGKRDFAACAKQAAQYVGSLPRGPSFANAAAMGLSCALEGEQPLPEAAALEPLAREAVKLPDILADDRSGLYETLVDAREAAKDDEGVKALAGEWLGFLEREAAKATTPEARAAFDPHRVAAAIKLKDPSRAVPALQQSEKDLPGDYNAPARLALLYKELGRYDDALAAIDRALGKVYGPRTVRLLQTKAQILEKKGDAVGQKKALAEALKFADALPAGQRNEKLVAALKAQVEKLP